MSRTPNLRERAAIARKEVGQIMALYGDGVTIQTLAFKYDVSSQLIRGIIHSQNIPIRNIRQEPTLSNKQIAARIEACRQPDRILWECLWCENAIESENMPLECKCGKRKFRRIAAPMPLDVSRLNAMDKESRLCLS